MAGSHSQANLLAFNSNSHHNSNAAVTDDQDETMQLVDVDVPARLVAEYCGYGDDQMTDELNVKAGRSSLSRAADSALSGMSNLSINDRVKDSSRSSSPAARGRSAHGAVKSHRLTRTRTLSPASARAEWKVRSTVACHS